MHNKNPSTIHEQENKFMYSPLRPKICNKETSKAKARELHTLYSHKLKSNHEIEGRVWAYERNNKDEAETTYKPY